MIRPRLGALVLSFPCSLPYPSLTWQCFPLSIPATPCPLRLFCPSTFCHTFAFALLSRSVLPQTRRMPACQQRPASQVSQFIVSVASTRRGQSFLLRGARLGYDFATFRRSFLGGSPLSRRTWFAIQAADALYNPCACSQQVKLKHCVHFKAGGLCREVVRPNG